MVGRNDNMPTKRHANNTLQKLDDLSGTYVSKTNIYKVSCMYTNKSTTVS